MRITLLAFAAVLVPLSCSQVEGERGTGAANIGRCPADFCRPGGRCDWGSTCSFSGGNRGCEDLAERDSAECTAVGADTDSHGGYSAPQPREPESRVPDAWTCDDTWYNDRRGCDCNCGVLDPDCGIEGQGVYRCAYGQTCDAAGRCANGEDGPSSAVPDGWDCRDDYWDDGTCDCDCGVRDPDCDLPGARCTVTDPCEDYDWDHRCMPCDRENNNGDGCCTDDFEGEANCGPDCTDLPDDFCIRCDGEDENEHPCCAGDDYEGWDCPEYYNI